MEFKGLHLETSRPPALRSVEIAITSRCNFRCSYCCAYDLKERKKLTAEDVVDMLGDLPDLQAVKLSGGEVLLDFDVCLRIVQWCSNRGIHSQINTNGSLLDRTKLLQLAKAGLDVLHFSLNHTDARSHAHFYAVSEQIFPRIVENIAIAAAHREFDTVVETILFSETHQRMPEIHRFIGSLGVTKQEIQAEIPSIHTGYGAMLRPNEVMQAVRTLIDNQQPELRLYFSCMSAYFGSDQNFWSVFKPGLQRGSVVIASCIEGRSQLHVHSNGDILICELGQPAVIGNVFQTSLIDIFNSPPEPLRAFLQSGHDKAAGGCFRSKSYPTLVSKRGSGMPGVGVNPEPVFVGLQKPLES